MTRPWVRRTVLLVTVAALAVAAGCTSSKKKSAGTQSPTTASASATDASSPTDSSASPTATAAPTATAPPTGTAPATPPPAPAGNGCTTAGLTTSVLRGSGSSGQVISMISFANRTATPCTLTGYPGVSLLLGGAPLGRPAVRSGAAYKTVTLAAGAAVQAQLIDTTTCNAAQSDTVRVYPPNQTVPIDAPLVLRGCALTVGPVAQ